MLCRVSFLGCFLIVGSLLLFAGSAGAQDVSPRCQAAMDSAAGDYSRCLLRADARYARDEKLSRLEKRQARCEGRFDRRINRALWRSETGECPSSDRVAAMKDRTESYAGAIASEASGTPAPSLLFVENGTGGTLSETTLTLTGVSSQTGYFSDRPYRDAGQMTTAEFVALFSEEGANSFAESPPNADLSCESGGEVVKQAVTLTDPVLDEAAVTLTYAAALVPTAGDDDSFAGITCDGDAYLFIDSTTATGLAKCTTDADCQGHNNYCKNDPTKQPPYYCQNPVAQVCSTLAELAAAKSKVCTDGGGTWNAGTSTCTARVTPACCRAGTIIPCDNPYWQIPSIIEQYGESPPGVACTAAASYSCSVGSFCSRAAYLYPPDNYTYENAYANDTFDHGDALAAGCNVGGGKVAWDLARDTTPTDCGYQDGGQWGPVCASIGFRQDGFVYMAACTCKLGICPLTAE